MLSLTKIGSAEAGSIFKLFKQLGHITKDPLTIKIGKYVETYTPPTKVVISDKFFRSAKCLKCGKCCGKKITSLVFLLNDLEKRSLSKSFKLFGDLCPVFPEINGKSRIFYLYLNKNKECDFIKTKGIFKKSRICSIHDIKPIHCALPMVEFDKTKDHARLIKRPRGRNWRFGCPAEFVKFDYDEFLNWDLYNLKRLQRISMYLNISTWLPEIIDYLEKNISVFKRAVPSKQVIIYDK